MSNSNTFACFFNNAQVSFNQEQAFPTPYMGGVKTGDEARQFWCGGVAFDVDVAF